LARTKKQQAETVAGPVAEIPDVYFLETPAQLKTLSEPMRYRMCLLLNTPMTCAALARELDVARPKAHYHLKLLESVGLVKLHSEELVNGILEKRYITVGRMLDFTQLLPTSNEQIPANISAKTISSISGFLGSMLAVSREVALANPSDVQQGHFFDFHAELTNDQYDGVKDRLSELREDIIKMTGENARAEDKTDQQSFHLTTYLSRNSNQ